MIKHYLKSGVLKCPIFMWKITPTLNTLLFFHAFHLLSSILQPAKNPSIILVIKGDSAPPWHYINLFFMRYFIHQRYIKGYEVLR